MTTEMPAEIDICGLPYTVTVDTAKIEEHEDDDYVQGLHLSMEGAIVLRGGLSPTLTRATAFHELVHASDYVAGVNHTEQDVCALSSVMFAVLRHNPDFVRWLMEW